MAKKKHVYHYNPHTLSYEKVEITLRDRMRKISYTVVLGVVLGVFFLLIAYSIIDSPKERYLKRELAQYRRQMEILDAKVARNEQVLKDLEQRDNTVYRTIFEVSPISDSARSTCDADYSDLAGYDCSDAIIRTTRKVDRMSQRLYTQSLSIDAVYKMAQDKQQRMASMPAIMPVAKNQCKIVSGFGMRYHPILHYRRMHSGIDMTAPAGTPVYATGDGTVQLAGRGKELSGYGNCVIISHGYGFQTLYGHLKEVKVRRGQKVKRGELLGTVGRTGLAQGNHLHYEVIQNGRKVNPVYFFFNDLSPAEYEEVIEAANEENQCLS